MEKIVLAIIILVCIVIIGICIAKKRPDLIVDFMLRASLGTAGIYLLDFIIGLGGYNVNVGVNVITILANGFLGLPGFILLYGLAFYYSMS
jgi:inhibitor of the pro-sigma K processing machinery